MKSRKSILAHNEQHPAVKSVLTYIAGVDELQLKILIEALDKCGQEGNRMAQICGATLDGVMKREPVDDVCILGLGWYLKNQFRLMSKNQGETKL